MHSIARPVLAAALAATLVSGTIACAPSPPLSERLASESRAAEDRARDEGRKPAEVIAFLGIEPGDTAVDLIAAGGYYTEVLSLAVGPKGRVYAQNNAFVLRMRDGVNDRAMRARLAGGRLPNVERLDRELDDLGLAPGSIDAALTALNFHDVYHGRGPETAREFLETAYVFLEPGGVLGLIDHVGEPGADNEKLHRIEEALAVQTARDVGFRVESSDLLRNPADDHTRFVFDPEIRGHTDRFLLKLTKPER